MQIDLDREGELLNEKFTNSFEHLRMHFNFKQAFLEAAATLVAPCFKHKEILFP